METTGPGSPLARILYLPALLSLAFFATPDRAEGETVRLTIDGEATGAIVLHNDASPSERRAAEELQSHLELMSGAVLPVKEDGKGVIYLGRAAIEEGLIESVDNLGNDGFIIRTRTGDGDDGSVGIAGSPVRGTMYGAYMLLETMGVRWWTPTESEIPSMKTIEVGPLDVREVPVIASRNIMYAEGHSRTNHDWFVRNRLNAIGWSRIDERMGGDTLPEGRRAHNSIHYVRSSVEEMTPDMWAQIDGEPDRSETCPSNGKVVLATIKSLESVYREHPDTPYVVLSHEDNNTVCRCVQCAEVAAQEGDSGVWWRFVNHVAEGLERRVPGARVGSGAYLWSRPPPGTIRVRDNVIVRYAPIETNYSRPIAAAECPNNEKSAHDLIAWHESGATLSVWNYVGNRAHYMMPHPDLDSLVANVRFFADHGARGIMQQGTHAGRGTEFVPLRMWVLARALWDPYAEGRELIDEFLEGYYGPAAPYLKDYIDIMHNPGRKNHYHLGRVTRMDAPFLHPDVIAEAEEVLRKAGQAVEGDETFERRMRHAHMPIWYVLAKRGPLSLTWRTVEERVGELNFPEIAANLNQVGDDYSVDAVADPEEAGPFFEWLADYGRLVDERGFVLPPELEQGDLETVRLLQSRQIDSGWLARSGWWVRDGAASDGWALKVESPRWLIQHHFSPYEECAGADRFRLFVRVRGGETTTGEGNAFVCGVRGDRLEVPAEQLADGEYHVFEVGEFDVTDNLMMYIALTRPAGMSEVYLDCLWLEPVATGNIAEMDEGESFLLNGRPVTIERMSIVALVDNEYSKLFGFDSFDNPKLHRLREQEGLDEVVAGGEDEFDRQVHLLDWTHERFSRFGRPSTDADGALEILEAVDEGHSFFCSYYASVMVSSAASQGWICRLLALRRPDHLGERSTEHSATEMWSNQHAKWVLFDPTYAVYFEKDGVPLNAWEVRREWFHNEGRDLTFVIGADRQRHTVEELPIRRSHHPGYGWLELGPNTMHKLAFLGYVPNTDLMDSRPDWDNFFITRDELCEGTRWHRRPAPSDPENEPYFPVNQAALDLWPGDGNEIRVHVRTMTPNFATFQRRTDGGEWEDCGDAFGWALGPGKNVLEVRSVNRFGVHGPASTVELTMGQ